MTSDDRAQFLLEVKAGMALEEAITRGDQLLASYEHEMIGHGETTAADDAPIVLAGQFFEIVRGIN